MAASPAQGDTTERVSVSSTGVQGNSDSGSPSTSADGRYVAFVSSSTNLVPGDTNNRMDVFVHDRLTGQTERVSVSSSGVQGGAGGNHPSISADGRYVAFVSSSMNLVSTDTSGAIDIFVHDRLTGQTERVSVSSSGVQGKGNSEIPSISANGRYVAFTSFASNLIPGDTNGMPDVFVHDRLTGQTELVSVSRSGEQGGAGGNHPSISADGRYVAFQSIASNLVPGDNNGWYDTFVHDRLTGQTELVSVSSSGELGNDNSYSISYGPSISANSRYVAFVSDATNLAPTGTKGDIFNVYVHDRLTGQTELVSVSRSGEQASGSSSSGHMISANGRYVAFASIASNLGPGDSNDAWDIFVHDRLTGQTERVSVSSSGEQGDADGFFSGSFSPSISAHGRYVTFASLASNLVPNDTNGIVDIFVRVRNNLPPADLPPTADFLWSPASPFVGQEVAFFDASTGFPTAYEWDFDGNGITDSLLANPTHVFGATGSQAVRLRVCNAVGCDVAVDTVTVGPASISISGPLAGSTLTKITFTASATGCTPDPTGWSWGSNNALIGGESATDSETFTWTMAGSKVIYAHNDACGFGFLSGRATIEISGAGQPWADAPEGGYKLYCEPELAFSECGAGTIDKADPTVVLTHGWEPTGITLPGLLWSGFESFWQTGALINLTEGSDEVNVIQFVWPGAWTDGRTPERYSKAANATEDAGKALGTALHIALGSETMRSRSISLGTPSVPSLILLLSRPYSPV